MAAASNAAPKGATGHIVKRSPWEVRKCTWGELHSGGSYTSDPVLFLYYWKDQPGRNFALGQNDPPDLKEAKKQLQGADRGCTLLADGKVRSNSEGLGFSCAPRTAASLDPRQSRKQLRALHSASAGPASCSQQLVYQSSFIVSPLPLAFMFMLVAMPL